VTVVPGEAIPDERPHKERLTDYDHGKVSQPKPQRAI
jgi:hypothetical protein